MLARAVRRAVSGEEGRGPQDLDQRVFLEMWKEVEARGREIWERRRRREGELAGARQSGKPGPRGRPEERTARRSGGKAKPNSASARANSASERPGSTWTPEDLRWAMRLSAREAKETEEGEGREVEEEIGGCGGKGAAFAARAERRRRPAMCAGFKPVILRSTSTMAMLYFLFLQLNYCFVSMDLPEMFL